MSNQTTLTDAYTNLDKLCELKNTALFTWSAMTELIFSKLDITTDNKAIALE